jgi:hypothetical protein
MKELKDMGQIKLRFHYITNLRVSATSILTSPDWQTSDDVPEKALKGRALSHRSA